MTGWSGFHSVTVTFRQSVPVTDGFMKEHVFTTSTRRDFLGSSSLFAGGAAVLGGFDFSPNLGSTGGRSGVQEAVDLPSLPYAYDALEPAIDAQTMRLHHDIHHAGYVRGFNRALDELARKRGAHDTAGLNDLSRALSFHGSGHFLQPSPNTSGVGLTASSAGSRLLHHITNPERRASVQRWSCPLPFVERGRSSGYLDR